MVKVTSLFIEAESELGFSLGVRAQTEMKIWCVETMYMLKIVSSERRLGVKVRTAITLTSVLKEHDQ